MNIVCVICSDLLEPSSDVYNTPCGHIFHFQCLTKWIERSKTCPQCRVRTTAKSIHRIYFNFPNDDSSRFQSSDSLTSDNIKLQSTVDSLNFKVTLANKEIADLITEKKKLELLIVPLKETIRHYEETIKNKDSAILALKEQIQYCKDLCKNVEKKDKEIKILNMKLEKLQSVQDILDSSASEVDHMIDTSYSDISKLQTFVSVLKRELENSIIQKKRLREKASAKSKAVVELSQARSKLRQLEETLKNQEEEKVILQTKLLEMQTAACDCKCKINVVEKKYLNESKKYNSMEVPITIERGNTSNSDNNETSLPKIEEDNDWIITAAYNTENTPQNLKSQGFFSMTNRGIKRTGSNVTVPSILTKKKINLDKTDQMKKGTISNDVAFDGFGGHAKYDKFPKSIQGLHIIKARATSSFQSICFLPENQQRPSEICCDRKAASVQQKD